MGVKPLWRNWVLKAPQNSELDPVPPHQHGLILQKAGSHLLSHHSLSSLRTTRLSPQRWSSCLSCIPGQLNSLLSSVSLVTGLIMALAFSATGKQIIVKLILLLGTPLFTVYLLSIIVFPVNRWGEAQLHLLLFHPFKHLLGPISRFSYNTVIHGVIHSIQL